MNVKLMYINNNDKQNYPFHILKLIMEKFWRCLFERNNHYVIKIFKPTAFKISYKTLGDILIYSPMSPPSLMSV